MNVAIEKIGICHRPMPGARKRRQVTMKLIAPRIDDPPSRTSETIQNVTPALGEYWFIVSGA